MTQSKILTQRLIIGGIIVIGFLWSYSAFVIVGMRDQAWSSARQSSSNLLQSVSRAIDRDIELYDLSLTAVIEGIRNPAVDSLDPQLRQLVLFDKSAQAPGYGSIFALNHNGDAFLDSGSVPPRKLNGSDRKYFNVHRTRDSGLFIGAPWMTRVSGRYMIPLSRRLEFADNTFGGVVVGAIEMAYFQKMFHRFNADPSIHVDIVFDEGDKVIWSQDEQKPFEPEYLDSIEKSQVGMTRDGSFISKGSVDVESRLNMFSQVGRWPITVNVSTEVKSINAKWNESAFTMGGIVCLLSLGAIALLVQLRRELLRRFLIEGQLKQLAITDPLTKVYNRRRFDEDIQSLHNNEDRNKSAILYLDADNFKSYNDTYGHPAGDVILKTIADTVTQLVDDTSGSIYRIGGEEFAVILNGFNLSNTMLKAEEIRRTVEAKAMDHAGGINNVVTVSIGVLHIGQYELASSEQWLSIADEALYRAKHMGRNRVGTPSISSFVNPQNLSDSDNERYKVAPVAVGH
ncbi:diguanylate cyclase (GGDEF) domain-containing protein [Methylobacterium phyllostachyos]|uniref:diguanylate cyclase n=1 Tax=Methylobacterium phyllostachyos TaxID=582672 RepID=A0A1H0DLM4_9HYPH|nr:diguanylate cyclase [Methylobacterium phyllostachyos]SDN70891.1 diguanylate cyclase (GGDEF) domain-containing protein [Methylobacterium phyllostachyos]